MSECLFTPQEIEEELNERTHMLNVARYIHDEFYDVWRHAEKELEKVGTQMSLTKAISEAYNRGWEEGREALRKEIWEDGRDRVD